MNHHSTVLLVSLKYSPVHNTLCRALGEPLRNRGIEVKYLLAQSLGWTVPQNQLDYTAFFGRSRNLWETFCDAMSAYSYQRDALRRKLVEIQPDLVLFESTHPVNRLIASLARTLSKSVQIWFLLHEPYVENKKAHGRWHWLRILTHEWIVKNTLSVVDGLLVPSDMAFDLLENFYPGFGGEVLKVPLLFEDRSQKENIERRYFSFVGHAVPAKGIDLFFEIVEVSASAGKGWDYAIATSSDVGHYISSLSQRARSHLRVVSESQLADCKIDDLIRESWAVLTPYRRVTQSAVVPVAYMHGTPVISTRAGGMPEFVIPDETGYLVDVEATFPVWEDCFVKVMENFPRLSADCREFFLTHFDAELGPDFLRPMLESISDQRLDQ
jgi:glycosyltransferase involved in cell wall biosynthesis